MLRLRMNGAVPPLPPYAFKTCSMKTLPFTLNHLLLEANLGRHDTDHRHVTSVTASDKHMVASETVKIISYNSIVTKIQLKSFPVKPE
jgi:hypothetical protein